MFDEIRLALLRARQGRARRDRIHAQARRERLRGVGFNTRWSTMLTIALPAGACAAKACARNTGDDVHCQRSLEPSTVKSPNVSSSTPPRCSPAIGCRNDFVHRSGIRKIAADNMRASALLRYFVRKPICFIIRPAHMQHDGVTRCCQRKRDGAAGAACAARNQRRSGWI